MCLRCDISEEFPDKKTLNQHNIQVHQVGLCFKSSACERDTPYSIHSQERINCADCGFSTKHKTALQRHKVSSLKSRKVCTF